MLETLFANPPFAWAAAGLAVVPVLVHILNRRRHRRVPWAAMTFLLAANRRSARRTRFEQWLLMVLRIAVVVLAALTLARPRVHAGLTPRLLADDRHHVLVIDDSGSMQALLAAGTPLARPAFDHLQHRARRMIDALPEGDRVTVVTLSVPPRVVNDPPARSRGTARGLVDDLMVTDAPGDLVGALALVQTVLGDSGSNLQNTVHLLTDCGADLFPPGDSAMESAARAVTARARLIIHNLSAGHPDNLSIAAVRATDALAGPGDLVPIDIVVHNSGATRSPATQVRLRSGGRDLAEQAVPALDPDTTHTVRANVAFEDPGWLALDAELFDSAADALALDNTRRTVLALREHISVVVVDGKPDGRHLHGQAGYLVTALAPGRQARNGPIRPTVIGEGDLAAQRLSRFETVILCNVRRLESAQWSRVREHVMAGGGLIIFGGDLVDTAHYNEAAGDLLPVPLQAAAGADATADRFDAATLGAPLSQHFGGRPTSGLFRARIDRTLGLDAAAAQEPGVTWLAYTSAAPAIVGRRCGSGQVVVVGTTANMDWTNLPARGDYVTLVLDLLGATVSDTAADRHLDAGAVLNRMVRTAPADGSAFVVDPDGHQVLAEIHADGDGYRLEYGRLPICGWYRLEDPTTAGPLAVNLAPSERALRSLDERAIGTALQCEFEYIEATHPEALLSRAPIGSLALAMTAVLLVLLFVESFVALLFGHHNR